MNIPLRERNTQSSEFVSSSLIDLSSCSIGRCYCGNNIYSPGVLPSTSCQMPCGGLANETCGGPALLDVFNTTGIYSGPDPRTGRIGCFDISSLNGYTYASSLMSSGVCSSTCLARGFPFAGTFAGNTCKCGTSDVISKATLLDEKQCNKPCVGLSSGEICGGQGASVYNATIATASTIDRPSGNSSYVGCYNEGATRTLPAYSYNSNTLTNKECIASCGSLGFKYA